MATIDEVCERGDLKRLGGGLDEHEQPERLLYAFPHVVEWFDTELPGLDPELGDGRQSPIEQVDDLLHDYVSGADFAYYERSHSMHPSEHGVWELKTTDIRLFGWFVSKGVFVVADVDTAFRCKEHGLYAGYRGNVVRRRDGLNLDPPGFITGDYPDVL